jgi:transposase
MYARLHHMSAADLRAAAKRSANARQASRILAIAMVLDGFSRAEAARLCGMDRQSLRDWVHRYKVRRVTGASTGHISSAPSAQSAALALPWRCRPSTSKP